MTITINNSKIYIDGTTYAVSTKYAVLAATSTQCFGGTVRITSLNATTVEAWAGDNNTANIWRLFPARALSAGGGMTIPGVSIGPSQSIWLQSSAIGATLSLDFASKSNYALHESAGLEVDGTTYAVSTLHTVLTVPANEGWRGNVRIQHHGSTAGNVKCTRAGGFIEDNTAISPGEIIDIEDIVIGHATAAKTIQLYSTVTGVSLTFRGVRVQ